MSSHTSLKNSASASTAASSSALPSPSFTTASTKLTKTQQRFLRAFPEFTDELVMSVLASSECSSTVDERPSSPLRPALATPPQTPPEADSFDQSNTVPGQRGSSNLDTTTATQDVLTSASSLTAPTPMFCLDDFTCALQRDYLWQGTLFVTLTHICFYGRHFTKTIHIKIHFADLVSIDKERKLGMIPNTLRIRVRTVCQNGRSVKGSEAADSEAGLLQWAPSDGTCTEPTKEYVLTSFLSRDQAYAAIERHWNIHKQLQVHQQALLAQHRRSMEQLRSRQGLHQQSLIEQGHEHGSSSGLKSSGVDGESMSPRFEAVSSDTEEPAVGQAYEYKHEHEQQLAHDGGRSCDATDYALLEPKVASECLHKLEHVHRLHASTSNSSLRTRRKAQRTYSVITSEAPCQSSELTDMEDNHSSDNEDSDDDDNTDYGNPIAAATYTFEDRNLEIDSRRTIDTRSAQQLPTHTLVKDGQRPGSIGESITNADAAVFHAQEPDAASVAVTALSGVDTGSAPLIPNSVTSAASSGHKKERVVSSSSASIMSDRSSRLMGPPMLISPSLTTTKVSHSSSTVQSTAKEGEAQHMTIHRREGSDGALMLGDEGFVASSYASSTMSMRSGGPPHPRYHQGSTTTTTTATTVEARGVQWGGSQISLLSTISSSSLESLSSVLPTRHQASDLSRMPDLQETEEVLLEDDELEYSEEDAGAKYRDKEDGSAQYEGDNLETGVMDEPEECYPSEPVDCGCERHYKNAVVSSVIPLSVDMCFEILFSSKDEGEGDRLACDVHRMKDGSTEFNIQPWKHDTPEDQTTAHEWENKSRELEYSVSFKMPMLAKASTACYEVQKILKHTPHMILVHSESRTPNVPYGEHFTTVSQICLTFEAKGQTRVKMFTEVKFKKSLMWSGRIEAGALEGSGGFWKALIEQLDVVAKDPVFLMRQERLKEAAAENKRQEQVAAAKEALLKKTTSALASQPDNAISPSKKKAHFQTHPSASRRRMTIDRSKPIPILQNRSLSSVSTAATAIQPNNITNEPLATVPPTTKTEPPTPMVPGGILATLAATAAANAAARPLASDENSTTTPARSLLSLQHLRQLQQQQQLQQIAQQNYRASFESISSVSSSGSSLSSSSGSLSKQQPHHRVHKKSAASSRRPLSQPVDSASHPRSAVSTMVGGSSFAAATAFFTLGRSSAKRPFFGLQASNASGTGMTPSLSPLPSPVLSATPTTESNTGAGKSGASLAVSALLQQQYQKQYVSTNKEVGSSSSSLATLGSTSSSNSATTASTNASSTGSSLDDFVTKLQTTWDGWMTDVMRIGSNFSILGQKGVDAATDGASNDGNDSKTSAADTETSSVDRNAAMARSDADAKMRDMEMDTSDSASEGVSVSDEDEDGDATFSSTDVGQHSSLSSATIAASAGVMVDKPHRAVSSVLFLCVILALVVSVVNVLKLMHVVSSLVHVVEVRHQWMVTQQQQFHHFQPYTPMATESKSESESQHSTAARADLPLAEDSDGVRQPLSRLHHHFHHHHHHYYHGQDGTVVVQHQQRLREASPSFSSPSQDPTSHVMVLEPSYSSPSTLSSVVVISKPSPSSSTSSQSASSSTKPRNQTLLREIRAQTQAIRNEINILKRQLEEGLVD
ncbi:hypothetical protein BGW42_001011 [Actinomortierella wolfii]|nr:hypothetical protein BGW42_001011 [Actinomortierella wolfii]